MKQIDQIGPKIGQLDWSGPNMIFKEGGGEQGVIEAISMQQYIC